VIFSDSVGKKKYIWDL